MPGVLIQSLAKLLALQLLLFQLMESTLSSSWWPVLHHSSRYLAPLFYLIATPSCHNFAHKSIHLFHQHVDRNDATEDRGGIYEEESWSAGSEEDYKMGPLPNPRSCMWLRWDWRGVIVLCCRQFVQVPPELDHQRKGPLLVGHSFRFLIRG